MHPGRKTVTITEVFDMCPYNKTITIIHEHSSKGGSYSAGFFWGGGGRDPLLCLQKPTTEYYPEAVESTP